jgi:transcriptional regulator with XRE-family HTH domain
MGRQESSQAADKDREFLAHARRRLRIPQARLAKQTGIAQAKISRWENGFLDITPEEREKIFSVLDEVMANKAASGDVYFPKMTEAEGATGASFADHRKAYGITQQELAIKANVPRSSLSLYENGYITLDEVPVSRLHNALAKLIAEKEGGEKSGKYSLSDLLQGKSSLRELSSVYQASSHSNILRGVEKTKEELSNDDLYRGIDLLDDGLRLVGHGLKHGFITHESAQQQIASLISIASELREMREYELSRYSPGAYERSELKQRLAEAAKVIKDLSTLCDVKTKAALYDAEAREISEKISTVPVKGEGE